MKKQSNVLLWTNQTRLHRGFFFVKNLVTLIKKTHFRNLVQSCTSSPYVRTCIKSVHFNKLFGLIFNDFRFFFCANLSAWNPSFEFWAVFCLRGSRNCCVVTRLLKRDWRLLKQRKKSNCHFGRSDNCLYHLELSKYKLPHSLQYLVIYISWKAMKLLKRSWYVSKLTVLLFESVKIQLCN